MLFKRKTKTCDSCKNVKAIRRFLTPNKYLSALGQMEKLLASGNYEILFATCPIDKVMNDDGYWYDDIIAHEIRCKQCGTIFICSCDTYHGRGMLERKNSAF